MLRTVLLVSLHVVGVVTTTQLYRKRSYNRNGTLVLMCQLRKVQVRSMVECYLITTALVGNGAHYSSSSGACNICLPTSTMANFTTFGTDVDYYSAGGYNSGYLRVMLY